MKGWGFGMSKLFEILYALNQKSELSQRKLSQTCQLSIGKVNTLIKKAEQAGYITISRESMKHSYRLTEKGIEIIDEHLTLNNDLKIRTNAQDVASVKTAVVLAAGKRCYFDCPVTLLKIDEETTLLERTLRILLENNMENIVIVTGYKHENFNELLRKYPKINILKNLSYQHSGTMKSLAMVDKIVKDDFLLIEGDIIYEARAIKQLLAHPERDCMIITNESGSGDEAFVEIRNNYLYSMTKDRHQLNKIDGEMIGLSKISSNTFRRMMLLFEENKNPYLNYEYMLMDIGRKYKIGFEKISDLVWWEFDTKRQFDKFKKDIYRKLYHQEKAWQELEVKTTIATVLQIEADDITAISLVGGMTNTSYKVTILGKKYIARIPGTGTEGMINRVNEQANCVRANELGLDAEIVYIDAKNGVKIATFIEGVETLTAAMTKREDIMDGVVKLFKTLHHSGTLLQNDFDVFEEIVKYEQLVNEVGGSLFEDYPTTRAHIMSLKMLLEKLGHKRLACHNDTGSFNILKDKQGRFYLIDWEYAGNNDPMWDLAAHALESEFSLAEETLFLQKYFENDFIPEEESLKFLIFQICQDFLWSIWTCIKEAKGNDFGTYGIDRYERAKVKLDELEIKLKDKGMS